MTVAQALHAPACRAGQPLDLEMTYRADITGDCRWSLERWWSREPIERRRILPWIMLNPSTADGAANDPTLCRIIRFSWRWGFDGLLVVNLFPYRSPAPAALREWVDWHKRQAWDVASAIWTNEDRVAELLAPYDAAIAAWGAQPGPFGIDIERAAASMLEKINEARRPLQLFCLGTAADGRPKHPMARGLHRVPDDALPFPLPRYPGSMVEREKDAVA